MFHAFIFNTTARVLKYKEHPNPLQQEDKRIFPHYHDNQSHDLKHRYFTFCSAVCLAALVAPHRSGNRGVCHIEPSEPSTHVHPGERRPWRPSHPRHPVCQKSVQTRTLGFLWCSDPVEYKHRRLGHTSRIRAWGFQGLFGMLSCLPSEKPCLQHRAEVYRNSWWRLSVRAANLLPPLNLRYVINPNFFDFRFSSSASSSSSTLSGGRLADGETSLKEAHYRHHLVWEDTGYQLVNLCVWPVFNYAIEIAFNECYFLYLLIAWLSSTMVCFV